MWNKKFKFLLVYTIKWKVQPWCGQRQELTTNNTYYRHSNAHGSVCCIITCLLPYVPQTRSKRPALYWKFISSDRLNALATTYIRLEWSIECLSYNVYSTQFVATRIRSRDILMPLIYFKAVEELLYPICSELSFQYNYICLQGQYLLSKQ